MFFDFIYKSRFLVFKSRNFGQFNWTFFFFFLREWKLGVCWLTKTNFLKWKKTIPRLGYFLRAETEIRILSNEK